MKKIIGLLSIAFLIFAYWRGHRPITYGPGVIAAAEPVQANLAETAPFDFGEFHLKPLATLSAEVRLLHSKVYRYDRQAALAPIDLAVGWGAMSDESVLDRISISQSMRFFWYEYKMPPPIAEEQIISHATNIHIIPATPALAARAKGLRGGALFRLSGKLVEATGGKIGTWRSSMRRTDSGNGACELLFLEDLETAPMKDGWLAAGGR